MPNPKKLSAFRQLSLHCESPPRSIKLAWAEDAPAAAPADGLVARQCPKAAKNPPKLTRHPSLEHDSILYTRSDIGERLRTAIHLKTEQKRQQRTNLDIFLSHSMRPAYDDEPEAPEPPETPRAPPRIIAPLLASSVFQTTRKPKAARNAPLVVVPIAEPPAGGDPKAVEEVIIRSAAARRSCFQKRANSAFSTIKATPARAPLARSASADPKPKFLAGRRRARGGRRREAGEGGAGSNKENPIGEKEVNGCVAVSDIVTMVSLVSPAASDTEEAEVEKGKKCDARKVLVKEEEKEACLKNFALRKTVKSVSFQQSNIHAIRSFSASFPGRRASMVTALMLGESKMNKSQEKRGTNSTDDDERVPKRRLVRSASEKINKSEENAEEKPKSKVQDTIKINITTRTSQGHNNDEKVQPSKNENISNASSNKNIEQSASNEQTESNKTQISTKTITVQIDNENYGSVKEKQCWDMYCKMSNKGLKVSYDTILRGMLTPTEYRMRKKDASTEEIAATSLVDQRDIVIKL